MKNQHYTAEHTGTDKVIGKKKQLTTVFEKNQEVMLGYANQIAMAWIFRL
jgi:hypothetical protein